MGKSLKDLKESYSLIYAVTTEFNELNTPKPDLSLWQQIKQMPVAAKKILALISTNNPINNTPEAIVATKKAAKPAQPLSSSPANTPDKVATGPSTR